MSKKKHVHCNASIEKEKEINEACVPKWLCDEKLKTIMKTDAMTKEDKLICKSLSSPDMFVNSSDAVKIVFLPLKITKL